MDLGKGGLIRSKTGCLTCRIRRVKCDETKPSCNRCTKTGRKCDGYGTFQPPASKRVQSRRAMSASPPVALPALPNFDDPRQKEFFAFFVSCAYNASSLYLGANFWARRVLQLSLSEASIRYALCSLSALHRMTTVTACVDPGSTSVELRSYALQQYNQAVKYTQTLLVESSDGSEDKLLVGLVACALFVCYENFTGNSHIAHMHLQNGLRIIARERRKSRPSSLPKDVTQVFKRLDVQALTFRDSKVPIAEVYPEELYEEPPQLLAAPSSSITFIEDSMEVVLHLCKFLFRMAAHAETCPIPPSDLNSANKVLEQWNLDVDTFLVAPNNTKSREELQSPVALLKIYQIIMSAILVTGVHGRETLHDNHLQKYQQVVCLTESLVTGGQMSSSSTNFFCFDVGVIFPLFWVATKCRDSRTRWRAVEILSSLNHQEGTWKSTVAAKVAEFVIGVEEEGLPVGVSQSQVPESSRVHLVNTIGDAERGEISLKCLMRSEFDGSWYIRDGCVSYGAELGHFVTF